MQKEEWLALEKALGQEAQLTLVGGAVRDLLLVRTGGDWDLATALTPDTVMAKAKAAGLKALPTGLKHGTVTVLLGQAPVEITTFRSDGPYLDGRRPAQVALGVSLEEDLARRDFTINAMAIPITALREGLPAAPWHSHVIDPFGGQQDLQQGQLRAVGDPLQRFQEDGLRPLRACRFASQLGFEVEDNTRQAIPPTLHVSAKVAVERVWVEMTKLLMGHHPAKGLRLLAQTGLLDLWLPELRPTIGCSQNHYHTFDVWEHTLHAIEASQPLPHLRWALLLHDMGKPTVKVGEGPQCHFYGHEKVSVHLAKGVLERLKASGAMTISVLGLIKHHSEAMNGTLSAGATRRLLKRLGDTGVSVEDWIAFRRADRLGKAPHLHAEAIAQVDTLAQHLRTTLATRPPLTVADLALDSRALMALAQRRGGPWLGALKNHLLEAVMDDPSLNQKHALTALALQHLSQNPIKKGSHDAWQSTEKSRDSLDD